MEIEAETIHEVTLADFAKRHGLVMQVKERPVPAGSPNRFYASFKNCEVSVGGRFLSSTFGDGATQAEAIENYGRSISLQRLVIGAYTPERREIDPVRIS